jgi:hypothetical protein
VRVKPHGNERLKATGDNLHEHSAWVVEDGNSFHAAYRNYASIIASLNGMHMVIALATSSECVRAHDNIRDESGVL